MNVIGIDIGTTNCKVALIEVNDLQIKHLSRFKTPISRNEHGIDMDITELWLILKRTIKEITLHCHEPIHGISIASVGESGVLVDEFDNVIGPCIAWFDSRGYEFIQAFKRKVDLEEVYNIIGLTPHSNYSVPKIKWLQANFPEISDRKVKWLSVANYIAYKLTGVKTIEASLASRTMAFDIRKGNWSHELLSKFTLDRAIFPELVQSGEHIGSLLCSVAKELGIRNREMVKVAVAGHDHMVGSLCVNLNPKAELLNSTGTTEGLLYVAHQPIITKNSFHNQLSNGIYVREGLFSFFGSLPSAGKAFQWAKQLLGMEEQQFFFTKVKELEKEYVGSDSLAGNAILVPHLNGSGPPLRSVMSKGMLYGLTEQTSQNEFILSVYLGLCMELKHLWDCFKESIWMDHGQNFTMKVIGPAAHNPLWVRMKADILGMKVVTYDIEEAVVKGAVLSIGLTEGWIKSKDISMHEKEVFHPHVQKNKYFEKLYDELYCPLFHLKTGLEKELQKSGCE